MAAIVAAQEAVEASPTAVVFGALPKQDEETMAAIMVAPELAITTLTAVKTWAPPERGKGMMETLEAAHEAAEASQTMVEAGAPHGQDEESMEVQRDEDKIEVYHGSPGGGQSVPNSSGGWSACSLYEMRRR